jgi:hypothetical protein
VFVHFEADKCDDVVFTAYRLNSPEDVLTEEMVGCGVARGDGVGVVWFDAGNFKRPWHDDEELLLIIEAEKDDRGHYAVIAFDLDAHIDVQDVAEVELVQIPEAQDHVIGYSLFRDGLRLNSEILAEYTVEEDIVVRAVVRGGYETVYGSSGVQGGSRQVPVAYAFGITPNPFSRQTNIAYALPEQQRVDMLIYDVMGRQVTELVAGVQDAGYYTLTWSGTDAFGRQAAAGVYFVSFHAGNHRKTIKAVQLR